MDFAGIIQTIGGLVVLASVAGSVIAVLVTSRSKASTDALREQNKDQGGLIDTLRQKSEMQSVDIVALKASESRCQEQVNTLTELVTRAAAVNELGAEMRGLASEILDRIDSLAKP